MQGTRLVGSCIPNFLYMYRVTLNVKPIWQHDIKNTAICIYICTSTTRVSTFLAARRLFSSFMLWEEVLTMQTLCWLLMPVSFNVAIGKLNILEAFRKPLSLPWLPSTLILYSIPCDFLHYLTKFRAKKNKCRIWSCSKWIPNTVQWTISRHPY
jgi:hypothetical protein